MDCILEFLKDLGSYISYLNLFGGIYMYFRYDKKIKCQEKRLNEFQIKHFLKVEDEEKMADFCCNINPYSEDSRLSRYIINFINIGKANAENVRIEILNSEDELKNFVKYEWGPYNIIDSGDIKSEPIKIIYLLPLDTITKGVTPEQLKIKITWDDDYGKNRYKELSPYFNKIVF